jgi:hypothetical protein
MLKRRLPARILTRICCRHGGWLLLIALSFRRPDIPILALFVGINEACIGALGPSLPKSLCCFYFGKFAVFLNFRSIGLPSLNVHVTESNQLSQLLFESLNLEDLACGAILAILFPPELHILPEDFVILTAFSSTLISQDSLLWCE